MLSVDAVGGWKRAIASYDEGTVSEFCKKAACILIDASEGATKPVRLVTRDKELGMLLAQGGHDMNVGDNHTIAKSYREEAYLGSCSTDNGIVGTLYCLFLDPQGAFVNCDGDTYAEIPFDPDVINSYVLPA